jgi:hypothetical protein
MLRHRVRAGRLERVYPKVFALAGLGWTPARRLRAAVLAGGDASMGSHRGGAWAWALTRFEQRPEISVPRGRNVTANNIRVHRPLDLPTATATRRGVPVTDIERTLIDLGAVLNVGQVRGALDRAIAHRDTTPMRALVELESLARNGRSGCGAMRAILDEAGVTGSHAPSVLEAKTRRLFRAADLPQPECELVAGANGEYRLDFPFPEAMLNVEVDGWQYHSSFDAFHNDRTRQNSLTLDGLAFLRYTWQHITRTPHTVIREVRGAYCARVGASV